MHNAILNRVEIPITLCLAIGEQRERGQLRFLNGSLFGEGGTKSMKGVGSKREVSKE